MLKPPFSPLLFISRTGLFKHSAWHGLEDIGDIVIVLKDMIK